MKKFDQINVIPFIDIMLVLLAMVLMTATFISQGKIDVNIPKANSDNKLVADDLAKLITITKTGQFYQDDIEITLDELKTSLAQWDNSKSITLKVDADTPFQQFVKVTDLLASLKLKKVSIVTIKDSP